MRRRILLSTILCVAIAVVLLGIPLMFTAWQWTDETTRADLQKRLDRMSSDVLEQERSDGYVHGSLKTESFSLLVPDDAQLTIVYPVSGNAVEQRVIGEPIVGQKITESLSLGTKGSLTLEIPIEQTRNQQWRAVMVVTVVVALSLTAGVVVAAFTASRLADPLEDVAERASRIARGDFRPEPRRHNIEELDRVSDVLDAATAEIADRLQRERSIMGGVSHQLRSRLTAIRLRLDELSMHEDPEVVEEATAAMGQVDRLTTALENMVKAAQAPETNTARAMNVGAELRDQLTDLRPSFEHVGRELVVVEPVEVIARVTPSRLSECVQVLVDNSLRYGAGTTTVTISPTDRSGTMARVSVTDEGAGISDDIAQSIFKRGFSGSGSTGVGLSLARALIEADGGRLELSVRRPPTFNIFVPAALVGHEDRARRLREAADELAAKAEPR